MKRSHLPFLFIGPSLFLLIAIIIFPLGFSLRNSFLYWNLQTGPNPMGFVGFTNFKYALEDPTFTKSLLNTIKLSFIATTIEFMLGLGIALLLNENLKGSRKVRALIIMPLALPGIIVASMFSFVFSWNNAAYPLVLSDKFTKPLPVGTLNFFATTGITWNYIGATSIVTMLAPMLIFLVLEKYVVRGLTFGAVKG